MFAIKITTLCTLVLSVFGAISHFYAHLWLAGENYALGKYAQARAAIVEGLAKDLGYEKATIKLSDLEAEELVAREAKLQGVNTTLAISLMRVESRKNKFAESHKGAIGLMQVMPFNAKVCGLESPKELWDDVKNVRCGIFLLKTYLNDRSGNAWFAVQEYNGGLKCINKCSESIKHAQLVLAEMGNMFEIEEIEEIAEEDKVGLQQIVDNEI